MGFFSIVVRLQNLWPFWSSKLDDLRVSDELVRPLSLPEQTRNFVYAVRQPESQSVIYVLSVQNLSERSATDAEFLIRAVRPDAVLAQVSISAMSEIQSDEAELKYDEKYPVPTSPFGVIKRCFLDKINKERYETDAGNVVLREIFGTCFHGHLWAAKRVAKEVGSHFMVLESSCLQAPDSVSISAGVEGGNKVPGLVNTLVPQKLGSSIIPGSSKLCMSNDVRSQIEKVLSSNKHLFDLKLRPLSSIQAKHNEIQVRDDYEVPSFAQPVYPLLVDLHDIFSDIPSIGKSLAFAQKLFSDINRGENVDSETISEVYLFRVAVEGLRVALNSAGRLPISKSKSPNTEKVEFSELSFEDKSSAILAHALQSHGEKFKTIVAIVDASGLAGLRKHWNTPIPQEIKDLLGSTVTDCTGDEETSNNSDKKRLLTKKPVLAVGAGATAVLGATSLSKAVPASTLAKALTYKIPASVKLAMTQFQKVIAMTASKTLGPSKLAAPGLTTLGGKSSVLNAVASAEKIRTVVHGAIASAEKTSFSAMRAAFYEIMRKRQVRPVGFLPWATFGCSIATCSGLLMFGDGIECAAESLPSAPSIACLGRGIQSLHQASQLTDRNVIQKSIETLIHRFKKSK